MNKELQYVGQGVLLLLVVLVGMKTIDVLGNIKEPMEEPASQVVAMESVKSKTYYGSGDGKELFANNCASCHKADKDLTGPALRGVRDRVPDRKLLHAWIKNSPAVLKSGNEYFNSLYLRYNKTPMSVFPNLTENEIDAILAYID
ncbi:c-type cytochrome [Paraflavitalea pollutisoli]|uniref:c-type cytochrome n=1 Tax=Paraflavitalea pollutisoli TaxID=3034143 RepID=UPI0023ECB67F|nr:cytochrome c [Paraflavitalea sp. H1-2-19X]